VGRALGAPSVGFAATSPWEGEDAWLESELRSSPFRGRWPRSGRWGPLLPHILEAQVESRQVLAQAVGVVD